MKEYAVCPADDLQSVLDRAESGSLVTLAPGAYRQKLMIRTPCLTLRGAGADQTVLLWDDYAKKLDEQDREYNTFRTWTAAVTADNVQMYDLAIVNDALHPETKGQEVALSVVADGFVMERCRLRSTQDTLFVGPLPADLIERYEGFLPDVLRRGGPMAQRFADCRIEGSVDFIFGCGEALFDACEIRSVYDVRDLGFAAAPAHAAEQTKGFTFRSCRFTAEDAVSAGSIFLARPWRDFGLCVFENCSYGPHISPAGFDPWLDSGRDKTARFHETPAVPGRVAWCRSYIEA